MKLWHYETFFTLGFFRPTSWNLYYEVTFLTDTHSNKINCIAYPTLSTLIFATLSFFLKPTELQYRLIKKWHKSPIAEAF